MGLSEQWASNIWLSGPLMGFFVAINADVNILANVAQLIISLIIALLMNRGILVRVRFVWSALLVFGAALLIGSKFITGAWYAYLVGIGMAVPISGINSFPFAIVGTYNVSQEESSCETAEGDKKKKESLEVGSQFGLLNLFIVVPQIICTLVIGELRSSYGDEGLSWAIFAAGISFAVAAVIALFIKEARGHEQTF
eukprot:Awhi_evm1s1577